MIEIVIILWINFGSKKKKSLNKIWKLKKFENFNGNFRIFAEKD